MPGIGDSQALGKLRIDVVVDVDAIELMPLGQLVDERAHPSRDIPEGTDPRLAPAAAGSYERDVIVVDQVVDNLRLIEAIAQVGITRTRGPQRVRHRSRPPCAAAG